MPLSRLTIPALLGAVLVLPFVILEGINRGFGNGFPVALFVVMWLLPAASIVLVMPLVRRLDAPQATSRRFAFFARIALALVIAWLWVGLVRDQMPCFLGVPNCD